MSDEVPNIFLQYYLLKRYDVTAALYTFRAIKYINYLCVQSGTSEYLNDMLFFNFTALSHFEVICIQKNHIDQCRN